MFGSHERSVLHDAGKGLNMRMTIMVEVNSFVHLKIIL